MSVKHLLSRIAGVTSAVVVLLGLSAGTALAWDHPECNERSHGSPPPSYPEHHYPSHPVAPPAATPTPAPAPAPAPAATPAPAPAPAPAAVPAPAPAPVAPAPAPDTPSDVSPPSAPAPERHVKGEIGSGEETPTTPVALIQSGGSTEKADTLPVTGLAVGIQVIFGAMFLMAGAVMFRRTSRLA